ncbi:hypothetical protein BX666DRAFT_1863764 [Dichotomocladium elegans]|nr:hypothetical protein BX666DRAFT_1863764 [Dichotomocladium elegans]
MSLKAALEDPRLITYAWLYKHEVPSFAFARSWKKRYIVLIDKTLYVFKSTKPTSSVREHFGLTDDTLVFVSEEFKKSSFVLEIRKPLLKWYLRCESANQLKEWLEAMKKVAACLKLGHRASLTASILNGLQLTDDTRLLLIQNNEDQPQPKQQLLPAIASVAQSSPQPQPPSAATHWWKKHQHQHLLKTRRSLDTADAATTNHLPFGKRQSLAQIPNWEKTLPPQKPPPQRSPPPPPPPPPPAQSSLPPPLSPVSEDH